MVQTRVFMATQLVAHALLSVVAVPFIVGAMAAAAAWLASVAPATNGTPWHERTLSIGGWRGFFREVDQSR